MTQTQALLRHVLFLTDAAALLDGSTQEGSCSSGLALWTIPFQLITWLTVDQTKEGVILERLPLADRSFHEANARKSWFSANVFSITGAQYPPYLSPNLHILWHGIITGIYPRWHGFTFRSRRKRVNVGQREQKIRCKCPKYLSCALSSNRCGEMYIAYKGRAMKLKYVGKRLKWWGYSKAVLLKV
ncbi:hypothetical protein T09_7612 [Trichinella sp. T9]|nr:hypothetical protein T09_7612 [Trichinella sp. T9]